MIICHCRVVNDRHIAELIDRAVVTVEEIGDRCGAGRRCGGCIGAIEAMLPVAERAVAVAR